MKDQERLLIIFNRNLACLSTLRDSTLLSYPKEAHSIPSIDLIT